MTISVTSLVGGGGGGQGGTAGDRGSFELFLRIVFGHFCGKYSRNMLSNSFLKRV